MANDEHTITVEEFPEFHYDMGFAVDGIPIPDPSSFSGAESDLDTMGERDATGYLHRDMVATKHPLKLEYKNISWGMIMFIGGLLNKDKFQFTYPSPFTGGLATMDAYTGDREFGTVFAPTGGIWMGSLKFSIIEY